MPRFTAAAPTAMAGTGRFAYVPSGKFGSWFPTWFNARQSLQYTTYNKFDGTSVDASDNNTLVLLLWLAG